MHEIINHRLRQGEYQMKGRCRINTRYAIIRHIFRPRRVILSVIFSLTPTAFDILHAIFLICVRACNNFFFIEKHFH